GILTSQNAPSNQWVAATGRRPIRIAPLVLRIEKMQAETRAFPMLANPGSAPNITCAHTLAPSQGQAVAAEDVRHLRPLAGHKLRRSGGCEIRRYSWPTAQRIQRAGGGADPGSSPGQALDGGDAQVLGRGTQTAVAEP